MTANANKNASGTVRVILCFMMCVAARPAMASIEWFPPAAPTSLRIQTNYNGTSVQLNWVDNSGNESGFEICGRPAGTSAWVRVALVGPDVRNASLNGASVRSIVNAPFDELYGANVEL